MGDPKGNSVKGSGAIRTIEGFATSGPSKMMAEETYLTYRDYYRWGPDGAVDLSRPTASPHIYVAPADHRLVGHAAADERRLLPYPPDE